MTTNEVIAKWDAKHHSALESVLRYVKDDKNFILFPAGDYRQMVTPQIFADLGFASVGHIKDDNGKKAFYKFVRKAKH